MTRYTINEREKRIHRGSPMEACSDDMADRVRRDLEDNEFLDLMNQDYVLCQHCMLPNVLTQLNESEQGR